ncbi:MAG: sialidase family protein [Armatimonadota bacterium]
MFEFEVIPPNPPNDGIMFVDHSKEGRSGHLGHALVEYEPGKILAFYPNCSDANNGHCAIGWMEFKRSIDGGRTWSEASGFPYSRRVFDDGEGWSVMCEKAVLAPDGSIAVVTLACDIETSAYWRPYGVPEVLRSTDGGATWEEPAPVSDRRGRVYDMIRVGDEILALEFCNDAEDTWTGTLPEHVYNLYVSGDSGKSFSLRSTLPFDTEGRGYGTMSVLPDGGLIAYVYNINDEQNLDYVVSHDGGRTWTEPETAFFERQIRNPQMSAFKDGYVLHGRSGSRGDEEIRGHFILYTSRDGVTWDAGQYLRMQEAGAGAYSNAIVVGKSDPETPNRLLIQASHAYEDSKTNILHWWLT